MVARSGKGKQRLPAGLSPAEDARWWAEHHDYWDSVGTSEEAVEPWQVRRTKAVNLRLPTDMIDALRTEAGRRALPGQTLIRMWLKERLDNELRRDSC
jgi:CopG antitoxin of type II toxin-antitoxin system